MLLLFFLSSHLYLPDVLHRTIIFLFLYLFGLIAVCISFLFLKLICHFHYFLPGAFLSSLAAGAEAAGPEVAAAAAAPLVEPPAATVLAMTAGVMLEV